MRRYRRISAVQSAQLWERWKKGEGLKSIGRVFGRTSSCIFNHIRYSGGIKPPSRRRSRLALNYGMLAEGLRNNLHATYVDTAASRCGAFGG